MKDSQTREVENEFLTISQAHKQNGDSYGYMLIPNVDRATFNQMVKRVRKVASSITMRPFSLFMMPNKEFGALWNMMILSLLFPTNQSWNVESILFERDDYKVTYYNPETQESAPDQEVFKKLEQSSSATNSGIQRKGKSEEEKNHSDQKISLIQEKVSQSWQV